MLNPALMYAATWSFVLALYLLGLSDLLEPLRPATVVLVAGTSLAFITGWASDSMMKHGRLVTSKFNLALLGEAINSTRANRRLKLMWIIFSVGICFEVILFRGAPGLGVVGIGADIVYTDFGVPGLHGLLNSMFYACCAVQFTRVLLGSSRRTWLLTLASLLYPVMCMSRQVLISLLLQYLFIYFSVRRPSARVLLRAGGIMVAIFLMFGYLGDIRSGRDSIIALAAPTFEYPDWLPSAFIWFYIYLSTPLNNVNFNIDITPNYLPLETAGSFIPSFARDAFLSSVGATQRWDLVTESFNVSSLLQSFVTDFGVTGSIAFCFVCGILFTRVMRRATTSPGAFFALIVLLHGIALSFFANLLFHLVFMFEILIAGWIVMRSRRQ